MPTSKPLRVAIIGGGLSGLCLCNALLNDPKQRFVVDVYERDTESYDSDRGGYQIRLGQDGIDGLKACLAPDTYEELRSVWGGELSRAPVVVAPSDLSVIARLNDIRLYPKSRAVPRQALKEYLLRRPLERKSVHFAKRISQVSIQPTAGPSDTSEVVCIFADGSKAVADILIASDGSKSTINKTMGINNVFSIESTGMIQGRCTIPSDVYAQLPSCLTDNGSMLFFTKQVIGFCAVYEAYQGLESSSTESFLFWGPHLPVPVIDSLAKLKSDEEKCEAVAAELERQGCNSALLPKIVRLGRRNVKTGRMSSSKPVEDWRAGQPDRGRVIFIGDSIHAMTPGRGQGANQAMKDAGELASILLKSEYTFDRRPSDEDLLKLARDFDAEMLPRAFGWVKASEQAFELDTDSRRGYYFVKAATTALQVVGMGALVLEGLGLRKAQVPTF